MAQEPSPDNHYALQYSSLPPPDLPPPDGGFRGGLVGGSGRGLSGGGPEGPGSGLGLGFSGLGFSGLGLSGGGLEEVGVRLGPGWGCGGLVGSGVGFVPLIVMALLICRDLIWLVVLHGFWNDIATWIGWCDGCFVDVLWMKRVLWSVDFISGM